MDWYLHSDMPYAPLNTGWRLPGDMPRQQKSPLIAGSCPITACCHYCLAHTLLAPRKWKNIFHFHHQMNCCLVIDNGWDTVEKQSCTSRTTNILRQHSVIWRIYLNYVSTISRQWGDKCWGTVEKQSCMSRTTNMQNTLLQRNVVDVPQLSLNYLPTMGRQMETVMAKWWVLETRGQQITTTLPQHIRKNWNIFGGKK